MYFAKPQEKSQRFDLSTDGGNLLPNLSRPKKRRGVAMEMLVPNSPSRSRERVARNFIKTYGRARFRRLLEALARSESGQVVAEEFGVSRERVRQWKNTFGTIITMYQVHPEVERILNERKPAVTSS